MVSKHATFGKSIFATFIAPIYFLVVVVILSLVFGIFLGLLGFALAVIIAFLLLIHFFASVFRTGMGGGFLIAVLAVIIYVAMIYVASIILGVAFLI